MLTFSCKPVRGHSTATYNNSSCVCLMKAGSVPLLHNYIIRLKLLTHFIEVTVRDSHPCAYTSSYHYSLYSHCSITYTHRLQNICTLLSSLSQTLVPSVLHMGSYTQAPLLGWPRVPSRCVSVHSRKGWAQGERFINF